MSEMSRSAFTYVNSIFYFSLFLLFRFGKRFNFLQMNSDVRSRVQLICEIECPCIVVLPLNQLSNQVILCETANIRISNRFQLSSLISKFQDFEIGNVFGLLFFSYFFLQFFNFL